MERIAALTSPAPVRLPKTARLEFGAAGTSRSSLVATAGPDGLVRIALKKPFSDGTIAVDLDPLSLLCRLVALVPAPRFHTVRYFGVLAAAAKWRPLVVPKPHRPE